MCNCGHLTWQYNTAHLHSMLDTQSYKHTLIIRNASFPVQQWLHERNAVLRFTYTLPVLVGPFAKLRKATITFVMSFHPSVRLCAWSSLASTGRIFVKFDVWVFFRKTVEKIQFSLNSDKYNGCFTWRPIFFFFSLAVLLRMASVSDKSCRRNRNTHFVVKLFFRK